MGSSNISSERESIAFGLTAIITLFSWDEEKSTDYLIEEIEKIDNINSVEIIDFRRALG